LTVDLTLAAKRFRDDISGYLARTGGLKVDLVVRISEVTKDLLQTFFHLRAPTLITSYAASIARRAFSLSWLPRTPSVSPRRLRRTLRATSYPSMPGICTSSSSTAKDSRPSASSASPPFCTATTSQSSGSTMACTSARFAGTSSTTSTLARTMSSGSDGRVSSAPGITQSHEMQLRWPEGGGVKVPLRVTSTRRGTQQHPHRPKRLLGVLRQKDGTADEHENPLDEAGVVQTRECGVQPFETGKVVEDGERQAPGLAQRVGCHSPR